MKKQYIVFSFVIMASFMSAQNKDTERADKLFARYEYVDAAKEYLELVEDGKSDGYVYRQLAESYYNVFNTAEASRWYAKAVETPQDAETYYRYAQMLKGDGKYEESNKQMQKFAQMAPQDQRAKAFMENPNYVPRLLGREKLYDVKRMDVSSDKSEFGPVLYGSTFYFTSARNQARKNYGWNEEPFLDVYKADYNTDGTITNAEAYGPLNTQYHDGPLTITGDGNTMYLTSDSFRENKFERDRKNKLKLGRNNLYRAGKDGDKWGNITRLPFSSYEHSTSNPSVTRDGKTLYFSSDMPGSLGGVDIWRVSVNADGTYGAPENLGARVNSEGNESFPYISDDNNTLYFASSGKPGLGGLDIFKIDLSKGTDAQNLGKPVNTEKDDFSFSFNTEKNIGFFASNRSGNDDIYGALPLCALEVITLVSDARTGAALPGARVAIVDDKQNVISTETADAKGEVSYNVECERDYTIQASMEGYEGATFPATRQPGGGQKRVNAPLEPLERIITDTEVMLKPIFFEYDRHNITREGAFELDKLVQVMKSKKDMVIMVKSHADSRGSDSYNLSLSDRRARATVQYVISRGVAAARISGKGYGETEPKVACGDNCTEEQHAMNRRSEFLIVK